MNESIVKEQLAGRQRESAAPGAPPPAGDPAAARDIERGTAGKHGLLIRLTKEVLRSLPPFLVFVGLVAAAIWGHRNDWTAPSFSELLGETSESQVAWCDAHGVPEKDCIACNAELMPKGQLHGWCKTHGVHECVLHHPELAQLEEPPDIGEVDFARAARAIAARPRTANDPDCQMHLRRIQFPSIDAVNRAGIDIGLVDRGKIVETIQTSGQVVYDPTRVAHLSSRANGTIWRVDKNEGDRVSSGDVLALIDVAEVGQAKSALLQALVQRDLKRKAYERVNRLDGVVPAKRKDEAESALAEADVAVRKALQQLANLGLSIPYDDIESRSLTELKNSMGTLGLPDPIVSSIGSSANQSNLVPIVAPREGIVVHRDAVAGETVSPSRTLFTIADTRRMWLQLNLRLEEAQRVKLGQDIIFNPDGADIEACGQVTWISTDVDRDTRTVRVRGELANPNGQLRHETFGAGKIVLRREDEAIVVPSEAIHWEGCCHVAFVRNRDYFEDGSYKVFHTRSVRPGAKMDGQTEVIAGLLPGEVVVTEGSGVLRAELLKGNLGAG